MLTQAGEARGIGADLRLACSLAGIAGALNAVGFNAMGVFSSNMTGNVSSLADNLAMGDLVVATTFLTLVAIFVSGAVVSTLLINVGRRRRIVGIYAFSILTEAVLLTGLACADLWLTGNGRGFLLAYGLSFLMGLQNAVVTQISNARVRTTHVTGMVTDIGIELGNLFDLVLHRRAGQDNSKDVEYNAGKLKLHSLTVFSFLAGGIFGVLAYKQVGAYFLFGAALLLLLLALPDIMTRKIPGYSRHDGQVR